MTAEEMKAKLFCKNEDGFSKKGNDWVASAMKYAEGYKSFIDKAKTEREAVAEAVKLLEAAGYSEYHLGDDMKRGGKYYLNNRGKALLAFRCGSVESGIAITAAHIDSPRLDLKQHPVYESHGIAYLKTHYYGGLRRHQWVTLPLALHGVVCRADGTSVDVTLGEDESEPIFYISDLLPHLSQKQNAKTLGEAYSGEKMNAIGASSPFGGDSELADGAKLNLLAMLNEKYGITEDDLASAELCFVPSGRSRDIGMDRMLIGAYGHDDTVCAYPALTAFLASDASERAALCVLADKEEIGSDGVSGMQSAVFEDVIAAIARANGSDAAKVRSISECLSADVTTAFDPAFEADMVFEKNNCAFLHHGIAVSKYTGARGKSSTSDASAEFVSRVRSIFDASNVLWQTSELGAVDVGGGGTVAKYIANLNISTLDAGVPVMSMHGAMEAISKIDLYSTYDAMLAFYLA